MLNDQTTKHRKTILKIVKYKVVLNTKQYYRIAIHRNKNTQNKNSQNKNSQNKNPWRKIV
jgi:predicted porin